MGDIYICYRRKESKQIAGRLFDRLQQAFGNSRVFMDVDGIPFGVDFHEYLLEAVSRAKIVLVLIGSDWAEVRDELNNRRLHDPDDFVRIEVETALKLNVPVGPLLIDGATMPKASQLPDTLVQLTRRNAMYIDPGRDFNQHCERLIADIQRYVSPKFPDANANQQLNVPVPAGFNEKVSNVIARPTWNLIIKVTVARQLLIRKEPCPVRLVEASIDEQFVGAVKGILGDIFPPFVVSQGSYKLVISAIRKDGRRVDHRLRLNLVKTRREFVRLRVTIGFEGELEDYELYPSDGGSIQVG